MCYLNNNKLLVWIKHDKKDFFDLIFHKICFIIHLTARGVFKMKKKNKSMKQKNQLIIRIILLLLYLIYSFDLYKK